MPQPGTHNYIELAFQIGPDLHELMVIWKLMVVENVCAKKNPLIAYKTAVTIPCICMVESPIRYAEV